MASAATLWCRQPVGILMIGAITNHCLLETRVVSLATLTSSAKISRDGHGRNIE